MCDFGAQSAFVSWSDSELERGERITTEVLCKALALDDYTRLALAELRLRNRLSNTHKAIARKADKWLISKVKAAKKLDSKTINSLVGKYVEFWNGWAEDNAKALNDVVALGHSAGKTAIYQRAFGEKTRPIYNGPPYQQRAPVAEIPVSVEKAAAALVTPHTTLADAEAIAQITKGQMFWVGKYHSKVLRKQIEQVSKEILLEQGLPREVAAKRLAGALGYNNGYLPVKPKAPIPTGWKGSTKQYFDGVAANAATVSRIHSSLTAMVEMGFDVYEILNPIDERTCPICDTMNGSVLQVRPAYQHIQEVIGKTHPSQVMGAHPWLSPAAFAAELSTRGMGGMVQAGLGYPPFHFRCITPGTLVWTVDGLRPIEDIRVGDFVLTHKGRLKRVQATATREHDGEVIKVHGVETTPEHPFLISRDESAIFDVVAEGDHVAKIKKSPGELRDLRQSIHSDAIESSYIVFEGMCDRGAETGGAEVSGEPEAGREAGICRQDVHAMRSGETNDGEGGRAIQVLLRRVQKHLVGEGRREAVPSLREADVGDAIDCIRDLLIQMQAGALGSGRDRPGGRSGPALYYRDARWDVPFEKLLGGKSCVSVDEAQRAVLVRTEALSSGAKIVVSPGFLLAEIGRVAGSEGVVERAGRPDQGAVSGDVDLGDGAGDEALGFILVGAVERRRWSGVVHDLTVEDDESFVIGEAGLVVHNCRCSIDIRPDTITKPVQVPAATKVVPPTAKPIEPVKPVKPLFDSRTAPTSFNQQKLLQAMETADETAMRQQLNSLMYEEGGMVSKDALLQRSGAGRLEVVASKRELGWADGLHGFMTGEVKVTRSQFNRAKQYFKTGDPKKAKSAALLVHESVHGASPIGSGAYRSFGIVVEEATTDLVTKHIMNSRWGAKSITDYGKYIRQLSSKVRGAARSSGVEISMAEAEDMATSASVRMRASMEKKIFKNPNDYVQHFADQVEFTGDIASRNPKAIQKLKDFQKALFDGLKGLKP